MTERLRFSIGSARTFRDSGQYTLALGHYVAVLGSISPERRSTFEAEFLECMENASATALTENIRVLSKLAQPAALIFPSNIEVIMVLNNTLYHNNFLPEAKQLMLTVSRGNSFSDVCRGYARISLANISSTMFHSWHIRMINDLNRNSLYEKAIMAKVSKNDFVLEVGSGTGLLSVFASRLATKVVGVEESKTLFDISKKVLAANNSKAEILNCHSNEYIGNQLNPDDDHQPFNVVISEIMDCCGFGEGILSTMKDIHQRLAAHSAICIPSKLSVYATIVGSKSIFNLHRCNNVLSEYHNSASKDHPYWCADLSEFPDIELLSDPIQLISVDLSSADDVAMERINVSIPMKICRTSTAHCIVVHFSAVLADGIILESNIPGSSWDHGIFPFPEELNVFEGRTISVDYSLIDSKLNISCREVTELHRLRIASQQVWIQNMDAVAVQRHWIDCDGVVDWRPWRPRCVYKMQSIPIDSEIFSKHREDPDRFAREFGVRNEWDYFVTSNCSSKLDGCDAIIWDPINADGTLNESVVADVLSIVNARWKSEIFRPVHFLPDGFVCRGMLVQSSKLSKLSRPEPDAHCGVDLASSLEDCHLFEYREINLASFPLESFSEEFYVIEVDIGSIIDIAPTTPVVFATNVIEVPATKSGVVDGMVYWWESKQFSNKQMLVAAFVFRRQIHLQENETIRIRVDYCNHSLLASLADD